MGDDSGRIRWFSPDPRAVFEFERFHVPRSLRKTINRAVFEIRVNTCFRQVMRACADRPDGTWITTPIVKSYCKLHAMGLAHSVEAWREDKLAGGLYGVAIGGAFFGESMFHRETDASKVALAWLMEHTRSRGFTLIDTQWLTPHLAMLGAVEIPRSEYLRRLAAALTQDCRFVP